MELALFHLDEQRVFYQAKQHRPDMLHMVLQGLEEDQDAVNVHEDEAVKHVPSRVPHQALEDYQSIG